MKKRYKNKEIQSVEKRKPGAPAKPKNEKLEAFALVSLSNEETQRAETMMRIDNEHKKATHLRKFYLKGVRQSFLDLFEKYSKSKELGELNKKIEKKDIENEQ